MEGHHAVAFYKRYKKIEGWKDNSIDRLLDFTDEAPSEEGSFQNSDTKFKDSRNVYSTRRYHQTQTSLAQKVTNFLIILFSIECLLLRATIKINKTLR